MATVKLKFKSSVEENKEGMLYYQITHKQTIKQIKTGYKIYISEWNESYLTVKVPNDTSQRAFYLTNINDAVKFEKKRIEELLKSKEREGVDCSIDDIIADYEAKPKEVTLFGFAINIIKKQKEMGKIRTAETYISAINSFVAFSEGKDISLKSIDSDVLQQYEAYLKAKDASLNTISFYMRALRAIYNRAVEKGIIKQETPFKRVYTRVNKTAKRAIPLKDITKIRALRLTHKPHLEFARDIFIFSFYTRGMSFIDIAYLRKQDVNNGNLTYRRRKTGQTLYIKWEECMAELASKYSNKNTEYLFPIITNAEECPRKQYIKQFAKVNASLKKIASIAGLHSNLTLYVARHSWASAARTKNVPISVISEGMGHDSELTTQIYLASLDATLVDNANKLILSSI